MRFATVALLASPLLVDASRSTLIAATRPQKPALGNAYQTDFFEGTNLKEKQSVLNNSDLTYTTRQGKPYFQPLGAQRAGERGPLLLQDTHLLDTLASFNRERIPERIVHARGAGAHGFLEITTDYAEKFSAADVFKKGTRTSATVRFSTVGGGRGSADEARDPRGFAIKLRTKKGILDWVFNNTPVFFIRDPIKFPRFIHTQKTDPATNVRDWNTFWSWPAQFGEAMLQFLRLFSDLGTPYGFRHMDGWSGHTYRLVKEDGSWVYARVYLATDQGIKNFTAAEAAVIAGDNDAWATKDLYDAIEKGDYPSWTVGIATKTVEEAEAYRYDVLDLTKDWPDAKYHEIGRLTLTQNPDNYFAEIEQSHFSPGHTVEGWEPSADPVLQSRLFSYGDAGRYRVGVNVDDVPVNCPLTSVANFDRDGHLTVHGNQGSRKNFPAEYIDPINVVDKPSTVIEDNLSMYGTKTVHWESHVDADIDFEQPRMFYEGFSQTDKDHLYSNVAGTLVNVDNQKVFNAILEQFGRVSPKLEQGIRQAYEIAKADAAKKIKEGQ